MNITDEMMNSLRVQGIINKDEILLKEGDLYVAKNVLNGNKRMISLPDNLFEGTRRVLKG